MREIKKALKNKLKNSRRIALLGIGSELNADDVAGMLVAKRLDERVKKNRSFVFKAFFGATAPENLTGEIRKFKPTLVVMVDAADFGRKPGEVVVIQAEEIEGISFSTHRLPTTIIAQYLAQSLNCSIVIIGIQPKTLAFGKLPSKEIRKTVTLLSAAIQEALTPRLKHLKKKKARG